MDEAELAFLGTDQAERKKTINSAALALLQLPFAGALKLSSTLAGYIDKQEDPEEVAEEFQADWGADASQLLIDLLTQLLAKEDDMTLLGIIAFVPAGIDSNVQLPRTLYSSLPKDEGNTNFEGRVHKLRSVMNSPVYGTIEFGGWLPGEMFAPPSETVDDLLRMPFGDALALSEELRDYLSEVEGSPLEAEFRQAWGPNAPESIRAMLKELLSGSDLQLVEEGADTPETDHDDMQRTLHGYHLTPLPVQAKTTTGPKSKL